MAVDATIIYRGPLQRSRLSLLGEAAAAAYGAVRLVWVSPRPATRRRVEHFQDFLALNPSFADWEIVDGRASVLPQALRRLRSLVEHPERPVIAVGFTALFYARRIARGRLIWCVNGIPEERLMSRRRMRDRFMVRGLWAAARRGRAPDLTVTVSRRMARLVTERCGDWPTHATPNCPVSDFFTPDGSAPERLFLTYLGTAAPWQAIDDLAVVWREMHVQDPELRFRVISRDEGCRVLGHGIAPERVEFVAADDPRQVGEWLAQARLGFLLRKPDLVNEVSFPLKFAEYLVAGAPVAASALDWDPADIVRDTGCGLLVAPGRSPAQVADRVREFLATDGHSARVAAAAAHLSRDAHVAELADRIREPA